MKRVLAFAMSCVFALSLAASGARAGDLVPQIQNGSCGAIHVAQQQMEDPNSGPFGGLFANDCRKLCKKTTSQCKSFSKRSHSCHVALQGTRTGVAQANCKAFAGDVKACLSDAKSADKFEKETLANDLALALLECDDWGAVCAADCVESM